MVQYFVIQVTLICREGGGAGVDVIYFSMQLVELEALLPYQMCLDPASTDKYRDYLTFRQNGIH